MHQRIQQPQICSAAAVGGARGAAGLLAAAPAGHNATRRLRARGRACLHLLRRRNREERGEAARSVVRHQWVERVPAQRPQHFEVVEAQRREPQVAPLMHHRHGLARCRPRATSLHAQRLRHDQACLWGPRQGLQNGSAPARLAAALLVTHLPRKRLEHMHGRHERRVARRRRRLRPPALLWRRRPRGGYSSQHRQQVGHHQRCLPGLRPQRQASQRPRQLSHHFFGIFGLLRLFLLLLLLLMLLLAAVCRRQRRRGRGGGGIQKRSCSVVQVTQE
mmetsp:Transcript_38464/g.114124  ORF Transcript_38464/g.114124 Transcript_38464/m.114124 type:complete len:276 (-) Transcript_38464:727-1554(-)